MGLDKRERDYPQRSPLRGFFSRVFHRVGKEAELFQEVANRFLKPQARIPSPQARIRGETLGQSLSGQQAPRPTPGSFPAQRGRSRACAFPASWTCFGARDPFSRFC